MPAAIAIKNPRLRVGMVGIGAILRPFGHFRCENVEVAVVVNVRNGEAVAVDHFFNQFMTDPIGRNGWIAVAFVPFQRPNAVARRDDNLQIFPRFESPRRDASADRADLNRHEVRSGQVLEPEIARQQIDFAIAIDVRRRHPFGVEKAARITTFARAAGEDRNQRPRLDMTRIGRDIGEENRFCALIPEGELWFAHAFEIAERLVVVLRRAVFFNHVAFPGCFRIEFRIRVFPPPDFLALPVPAENKVRVAVAVDVVNRAAGFDRQKIFFDHITLPTVVRAPVPDQRGRDLAETEHEIIHPVLVQIGDQGAGLLSGPARRRQIAVLTREMGPFRFHRAEQSKEAQKQHRTKCSAGSIFGFAAHQSNGRISRFRSPAGSARENAGVSPSKNAGLPRSIGAP